MLERILSLLRCKWLLLPALLVSFWVGATEFGNEDKSNSNKFKRYCPAHLDSGFSINVADVSMNPSQRLVRYQDKVIQMSSNLYAYFEALVLAHDLLRYEDFVEIRNLDNGPRHRANSDPTETHHGDVMKRVREDLLQSFGIDFSSRIVTFYSRGYAWFRPADPMEIVEGKIWSPVDRPYLMFGEKLVVAGRRALGMLEAFKYYNCRPVDIHMFNAYFEKIRIEPITDPSEIQTFISRANREIQASTGHPERFIVSAGWKTKMWVIRKDLVDFCK